jgi:hypothetical protein
MTSQSGPASRTNLIDGFIRQIVEASLETSRRRIFNEATTMSAAELRGYLRARALLSVRYQTQRVAAANQLNDKVAEQLVERALERTVNLLLREFTQQPPLILPIYEAPRRAAA